MRIIAAEPVPDINDERVSKWSIEDGPLLLPPLDEEDEEDEDEPYEHEFGTPFPEQRQAEHSEDVESHESKQSKTNA